MPHNPVIDVKKIGLLEAFTVGTNTAGILYQGQRFIRVLQPGDGLGFKEKLGHGETIVRVVDTRPHTYVWRVNLPSSDDRHAFQVTVTLVYRVADPERMINDAIADTEAVVTQYLEPTLRHVAREYALNHHTETDVRLEQVITDADLSRQCGVKLVRPPDVVITLSPADHAYIKVLNELERAIRAPRTTKHVDTLASSDPIHPFQVEVIVSFRVDKHSLDEMPSDSPEVCEEHLWPRIHRIMGRRTQAFGITQLSQAQVAVQDGLEEILDERGIAGYGIKVEQIDVFLNLDAETREHYLELAQIEHDNAVEAAKLTGLQKTNAFYSGLVQQGAWAALAVAASKGEISADELYQRLNNQQKEQLQMQIALLDKLRGEDALSEVVDQEASVALLTGLVNKVTEGSAPRKPALSGADGQPQLSVQNGKIAQVKTEDPE